MSNFTVKIKSKVVAFCICTLIPLGVQAETLEQAVAYAIQTNPEVINANNNRLAADQLLKQARSGYFPVVDIRGAHGRERSKNITTKASRGGPNLTLTRSEGEGSVVQNLFEGFRTKYEIQQSIAQIESASNQVNSTSQNITLEVVEAYLDYLRSIQLVRVAEQNLEAHQRTYEMVRKRHLGGLSGKVDLVQAEGRLALAQANLLTEKKAQIDARNFYQEVVGRLPENLEYPSFPDKNFPSDEAQAVSIAIDNNPSLEAARNDVIAAQKLYEASKSTNYPVFNLELSMSRNHYVDGVKSVNNDDLAMVTGSYNLLRGGADVAQQREAAYRYQATLAEKNRLQREVVKTTKFSWTTYVISRDQIPYLHKHKYNARETVRLFNKQFQLGQRTLLDLLDSEAEHFNAQNDYIDAQFRELFAKYSVLNNIGILTEALKVQLPVEAYPDLKQSKIKFFSTNTQRITAKPVKVEGVEL